VAQMVKHLPRKYEALSSREKKERKEGRRRI
jgi:hypothetical protein